jgi:NTE family protein
MAIGSFLFMHVNLRISYLLFFFLIGCGTLKTRNQAAPVLPSVASSNSGANLPPPALTPPQATPVPTVLDTSPDEEANILPPTTEQKIPKIGLILGPGGARTWAHIGFLQELQKEKIPIAAVAGIEWGSIVAGLYSVRGLVNEVEWQMMKIKPEQSLDVTLRQIFSTSRAEESKVASVCMANNLSKSKNYLMSKGLYSQMLPFCVAYPPHFKPWQGNVAAVREVHELAQFLRKNGATYVVFVNVLPQAHPERTTFGVVGSAESVMWNEIASLYSRPLQGVNKVLNITLPEKPMTAFDDRRELMQKGAESSTQLARQLAQTLGL